MGLPGSGSRSSTVVGANSNVSCCCTERSITTHNSAAPRCPMSPANELCSLFRIQNLLPSPLQQTALLFKISHHLLLRRSSSLSAFALLPTSTTSHLCLRAPRDQRRSSSRLPPRNEIPSAFDVFDRELLLASFFCISPHDENPPQVVAIAPLGSFLPHLAQSIFPRRSHFRGYETNVGCRGAGTLLNVVFLFSRPVHIKTTFLLPNHQLFRHKRCSRCLLLLSYSSPPAQFEPFSAACATSSPLRGNPARRPH